MTAVQDDFASELPTTAETILPEDRFGGRGTPGDTDHAHQDDQIDAITSVSDVSLAGLDLDQLLPLLLDRVLDLLRSDTAAVLLHDAAANQLVARAARGLEEEVRQGVRIPVGIGFAGRIAAERHPVVLDRVDESTVANPILWEKGICSMLGVPLIAGETLIGVLHVGSFKPQAFGDDDVMLLELAADKLAAAAQSGHGGRRTSCGRRAAAKPLAHTAACPPTD